jgi:hypothetical protein
MRRRLAKRRTDVKAARTDIIMALYRFVAAERDEQWDSFDLYAAAMSGRFGNLKNPAVANDLLKAADRLRAHEWRRNDLSQALLRTSRASLGVAPSTERAEEFRQRARSCEAGLNAVAQP